MFPTQRAEARAQPFSMSQMRGAISDSIIEFADAAESDPSFWLKRSREQKTVPGLIRAYTGWRELISYDNLNPVRQNQLDMQWDAAMRSDDRFENWFSDDKKRKPIAQVLASRPTGRIGDAMKKRVIGRLNPIAVSIKKQKPSSAWMGTGFVQPPKRQQPVAKEQPSADQLKRAGTEEAYTAGVKLGYWK